MGQDWWQAYGPQAMLWQQQEGGAGGDGVARMEVVGSGAAPGVDVSTDSSRQPEEAPPQAAASTVAGQEEGEAAKQQQDGKEGEGENNNKPKLVLALSGSLKPAKKKRIIVAPRAPTKPTQQSEPAHAQLPTELKALPLHLQPATVVPEDIRRAKLEELKKKALERKREQEEEIQMIKSREEAICKLEEEVVRKALEGE